ncbi:MAG: DUF4435 domain-containing protein [Prevotella sp.]|nr:DUF4435 domain-containing protein [Prevotella sp.]MBR6192426.1 DUF4435 domain-containing protein [Prevotella sp.]
MHSYALNKYITSDYVSAANKLQGKAARRRIVAYVESYDDVLFWRMVLSQFEDETRYFEVMLPTRNNLNKGKKQALMALMKQGAGRNMIACVDADYDYLIQGYTPQSDFMLKNPYVVHTYVYAIENYQCYAPSLHNVCVMATLNDHVKFDFVQFLTEYSRAIFQLFVWSVMLYRRGEYCHFSLTDFNTVVTLKRMRMDQMGEAVEKVRHKAYVKVRELQRKLPGMKEEYLKTKDSLLSLGVTPETTYLYVQGHHLFDNVVAPTVDTVCTELRREREREIKTKANHTLQMQNELSAYTRAQSDITSMMKKNQGYTQCEPYKRMAADVEKVISR